MTYTWAHGHSGVFARPLGIPLRRNFVRCTLGCVAAHALALAGYAQTQVRPEFRVAARSLISQTIDRNRMVPTQGALRREVANLPDLGEAERDLAIEHIQLMLARPAERQAAFDAELEALHTPGNPSFHRWLTPATVGSEFGPSASDIATVTSFLQAEGFTVNLVGQSGMFVDFTGTAAQVEHTFQTSIHNVLDRDGSRRFAAVRPASIPEALAPAVLGFVSLSDIRSVRPHVHKVVPAARPLDTLNTSTYFVGPQDFYTIYNENPLLNATTPINGTGRTIALLEQSDINVSDVTTFRTNFNVLPNSPSLTVMHGAGADTCTAPGKLNAGNDNEESEAALDVEWAGAVAPGANLLFMSCKTTGTAGIFLSAEAVIDNNLADVLSLSYGYYEAGSPSQDTFSSELWEQAASQGQTVVVSAGDSGSDTEDQNAGVATNGINVNGIASTAWNVSAGGTDFQDDYNQLEGASSFGFSAYWNPSNGTGYSSALSYVPEMPWNNTCASSEFNFLNTSSTDPAAYCATGAMLATGGGGGGPSTVNARPSWQTGTVYGLPTLSAQPNRMLPDISLFASNGYWGHALDYIDTDEGSGNQYAGGTSFVAPQLAGLFALIAQQTGERQGQPNYILYNMAGKALGTSSFTGSACNASGSTGTGTTTSAPSSSCIFYDIQVGNISQACTAGSTNCYSDPSAPDGILSTSTTSALPAYSGAQGYDMATGLGSVNINNLVTNWQSPSASELLTPTVTLTSTAATSTYGSPVSSTYTATVSGSGSFPTGSVTLSGSPTIGAIGTSALVPSSGCSSGFTCTESAARAYKPNAKLSPGSYTITATYSTTNENYISAFGTTGLTINQQTPTLTVPTVTDPYGNSTASLSASVVFTGTGNVPSGAVTFQVDSGAIIAATCTGSASPLSCTATYNVSALASGTHTITARLAADTNYLAASKTGTLNLNVNPATITFSVASPQHIFTPTFNISATSNSTGAFTYSLVSGPATLSGSTLTLTGAGTVMLHVSQAATSVYSITTANASFTSVVESIWFGNSNSSLSVVDPTGISLTSGSGLTGGGLGTIAGPLGVAFDSSADLWIATTNGISEFSPQGAVLTSTAYTSGGISSPEGVAIDGAGQVWIANANGTVSKLSHSGTALSPAAGYATGSTAARGIAVDLGGSVWVSGGAANTVTRILGAAAPAAPLATAVANATTGGTP